GRPGTVRWRGVFPACAGWRAGVVGQRAVEDAEQGWCGMLEGANHPQSSGLRSLTIRSRRSPRLRLVMLLTLSPAFAGGRLLSAFRLLLRTSRRPASNR